MRATAEKRFWAKVDKRGPDECWLWKGGRGGPRRAGQFRDDSGKMVYCSRFSYEFHRGPIPGGLAMFHSCQEISCVNPNHLFVKKKGSQKLFSAEERFWSKVNIRQNDQCWLWQGAVNCKGYGMFKGRIGSYTAHRFSYELANGPINKTDNPMDNCVIHSCDVPSCVNPNHLSLGTNQDNVNDRVKKNRNPNMKGGKNSNSKLSAMEVIAIRSDNRLHRVIADDYNISESHVSNLKRNGVYWKCLDDANSAPTPARRLEG